MRVDVASPSCLRALTATALLLVLHPSLAQAEPPTTTDDEMQEAVVEDRVPLTSIGAVSSLDAEADPSDPGTGGGIDMSAMFRNRFIPKLSACTAQMKHIFTNWASSNNLAIPYRNELPGDLTLHATSTNVDGLFELTYRVIPSRERARVTVFFVSTTGEATSVATIKSLIETWGITALQDNLDIAMSCDA